MSSQAKNSERRFRMRGYSQVHLRSWVITLDRDSFIPCPFKNCNFMAFDVEDMAEHFSFCNGNCTAGMDVCHYCNRAVENRYKLLEHIAFFHPLEATQEEINELEVICGRKKPRIVSKVLSQSWDIFLGLKGFVKCLVPDCFFLFDTTEEMKNHYLNCCPVDPKEQYVYICEYCQGKTLSDSKLSLHVSKFHSKDSESVKNVSRLIVKGWCQRLKNYGVAKCATNCCKYLDTSLEALKSHYTICRMPNAERFVVCDRCSAWVADKVKLDQHIESLHNTPARPDTHDHLAEYITRPPVKELFEELKSEPEPELELELFVNESPTLTQEEPPALFNTEDRTEDRTLLTYQESTEHTDMYPEYASIEQMESLQITPQANKTRQYCPSRKQKKIPIVDKFVKPKKVHGIDCKKNLNISNIQVSKNFIAKNGWLVESPTMLRHQKNRGKENTKTVPEKAPCSNSESTPNVSELPEELGPQVTRDPPKFDPVQAIKEVTADMDKLITLVWPKSTIRNPQRTTHLLERFSRCTRQYKKLVAVKKSHLDRIIPMENVEAVIPKGAEDQQPKVLEQDPLTIESENQMLLSEVLDVEPESVINYKLSFYNDKVGEEPDTHVSEPICEDVPPENQPGHFILSDQQQNEDVSDSQEKMADDNFPFKPPQDEGQSIPDDEVVPEDNVLYVYNPLRGQKERACIVAQTDDYYVLRVTAHDSEGKVSTTGPTNETHQSFSPQYNMCQYQSTEEPQECKDSEDCSSSPFDIGNRNNFKGFDIEGVGLDANSEFQTAQDSQSLINDGPVETVSCRKRKIVGDDLSSDGSLKKKKFQDFPESKNDTMQEDATDINHSTSLVNETCLLNTIGGIAQPECSYSSKILNHSLDKLSSAENSPKTTEEIVLKPVSDLINSNSPELMPAREQKSDTSKEQNALDEKNFTNVNNYISKCEHSQIDQTEENENLENLQVSEDITTIVVGQNPTFSKTNIPDQKLINSAEPRILIKNVKGNDKSDQKRLYPKPENNDNTGVDLDLKVKKNPRKSRIELKNDSEISEWEQQTLTGDDSDTTTGFQLNEPNKSQTLLTDFVLCKNMNTLSESNKNPSGVQNIGLINIENSNGTHSDSEVVTVEKNGTQRKQGEGRTRITKDSKTDESDPLGIQNEKKIESANSKHIKNNIKSVEEESIKLEMGGSLDKGEKCVRRRSGRFRAGLDSESNSRNKNEEMENNTQSVGKKLGRKKSTNNLDGKEVERSRISMLSDSKVESGTSAEVTNYKNGNNRQIVKRGRRSRMIGEMLESESSINGHEDVERESDAKEMEKKSAEMKEKLTKDPDCVELGMCIRRKSGRFLTGLGSESNSRNKNEEMENNTQSVGKRLGRKKSTNNLDGKEVGRSRISMLSDSKVESGTSAEVTNYKNGNNRQIVKRGRRSRMIGEKLESESSINGHEDVERESDAKEMEKQSAGIKENLTKDPDGGELGMSKLSNSKKSGTSEDVNENKNINNRQPVKRNRRSRKFLADPDSEFNNSRNEDEEMKSDSKETEKKEVKKEQLINDPDKRTINRNSVLSNSKEESGTSAEENENKNANNRQPAKRGRRSWKLLAKLESESNNNRNEDVRRDSDANEMEKKLEIKEQELTEELNRGEIGRSRKTTPNISRTGREKSDIMKGKGRRSEKDVVDNVEIATIEEELQANGGCEEIANEQVRKCSEPTGEGVKQEVLLVEDREVSEKKDLYIETGEVIEEKVAVLDSSLDNDTCEGREDGDDDCDGEEANLTQEEQKAKTRGKKKGPNGVVSGVDRIYAASKLKTPNKMVECAVCNEVMMAKEYKVKHMKTHNFMCWLQEEKPLPLDNLDYMCIVLTRGKRTFPKFNFKCELCNTVKKSARGFLTHVQVCGKSKEDLSTVLVPCPKCCKMILPFNMEIHMINHKQKPVVEPSSEIVPLQSVRDSAKKCRKQMMEILSDDEDVPSKAVVKYKHNREYKKIESTTESKESSCFTRFLKCVENKSMVFSTADSVKVINQLRKEHYSTEPVFPDLRVDLESLRVLCQEECNQFLPFAKSSMKVSIGPPDDHRWMEMDIFQSVTHSDCQLMYCGGPVRAVSWCPTEGDKQFVAVSTHNTMTAEHKISTLPKYPSLVQIWSVEPLNNSSSVNKRKKDKDTPMKLARMEYGVGHRHGAVWALEWCPSGGCIQPPPDGGGGGGDVARLGLLAMACSDGTVPLFSLPNPDIFLQQPEKREEPIVLEMQPSLILDQFGQDKVQCTCISWSQIKPHSTIVAGFANGWIAAWDLESTSSLLRRGNTLYPFLIFQAHFSIVTGLELIRGSDSIFWSSSLDCWSKCWDLRDTCRPLAAQRRGIPNAIGWLSNTASLVAGYDEAYSPTASTLGWSSFRKFARPPNTLVATITSAVTSVSTNDWIHSVVASYDNGQVLVIFGPEEEKRKVPKVVVESLLCDLETGQMNVKVKAKKNTGQSSGEKQASQAEGGPPIDSGGTSKPFFDCDSYEDAVEKYGLVIKLDTDLTGRDLLTDTVEGKLDVYPLATVNKVAWNPNPKSYLNMAVGYQSGFLLVSKLQNASGFYPNIRSNYREYYRD